MPMRLRCAAALAAAALVLAACTPTTEQPSDATSSSQAAPAPSSSTAAQVDSPTSQVSAPPVLTPVIGSVVAAPVPVPATDGKDHLAYELLLTNVLPQEVTLTSVAVLAGDKTLLSLAGDGLQYWTRVVGKPTRTLGPGQMGFVWLDVALDRPADGQPSNIPTNLTHAIGISVKEPSPPLIPATMTETIAPTDVQTHKPVVISPPLRGPNWLDGNSCCDMTAHRTAMNPINGGIWAAERFAIDYIQLNDQNRVFTGPVDKLESYPYFGADIHAVANGPVVAVMDNLPEEVPGASPTNLPLDQYSGNHIVQDIGDGNYALYAHVQPGSIKVKPGDQLTTGQVIASLGNSGNTDAPHLHFHVMSTPDPLHSNGLPFVFDSFRLDGRLASADAISAISTGGVAALQPGFAARDETDVSPLFLDIMTCS